MTRETALVFPLRPLQYRGTETVWWVGRLPEGCHLQTARAGPHTDSWAQPQASLGEELGICEPVHG